MVLLTLFAIVAGAATALTPCVLPVLPALLSAGGSGGRRRPLGIVCGLAITFTITIVGLATVVGGVGFADGTLRSIAIGTLVAFGLVLLLPQLGHWFEARLAFMSRYGPKRAGDGFWSGLPVGAALGFVYAPCAGPLLAAVISVSASQGTSTEIVVIGIGFSLGSAAVLLAITLGGRRLLERIRKGTRGPVVQRALGGVLVATAIAMSFDLDLEMQTALADDFPSFVTNPTKALEDSDAIQDRLADVRGEAKFDSDDAAAAGSKLPVLGMAPDFRGTQKWFNSEPLTIAGQRGKVTLVDFWTYTCINCLRTAPYLKAWDERYRKAGLTIVGVHTPEFRFERDASNVEDAIDRSGLRYPVVQDNDYDTWNAWGNKAWPSKYLVDARGRVRYSHQGEGDYDTTEAAIRRLLAEAGADELGDRARPEGEILRAGQRITPETYLGTERIGGFVPLNPKAGTRTYQPLAVKELFANEFTIGGRWTLNNEHAVARRGAVLKAKVTAKSVYLVMASDTPRDVRVLLDGRKIAAANAGSDVRDGRVRVSGQRLYRLVELDRPGEHTIKLSFGSDIRAFAFTFG